MYSAALVLKTQFGFISDQLLTLIQMLCTAGMLLTVKRIFNDWKFENSYFKLVFTLFMFYNLVLFVRGVNLNYNEFKNFIQSDYIFWPSVVPLVIFLNKDDLTFFYFIRCFYILAIIYLFISLAFPVLLKQRSTAEPYILTFAFTCGFLFLNARYVSKKITWMSLISLISGLLSFTYLARRNAVLSFSTLLVAGFYFLLRNLAAAKFVKYIPVFVFIFVVALLGFDKLPTSLTAKFNERLNEDSRSYVFDNYFKAMREDMIFGKGINGKYYSPIDQEVTDDGVVYNEIQNREVIENGYLQLLLKGGYVNIALFGLTLLPAAFLGMFRSKNQLSRACGVVVFLWLLDMSVYGLPRMTLQYFLVWMCAGICYKASFRNRSDEEITEAFAEVGFA